MSRVLDISTDIYLHLGQSLETQEFVSKEIEKEVLLKFIVGIHQWILGGSPKPKSIPKKMDM